MRLLVAAVAVVASIAAGGAAAANRPSPPDELRGGGAAKAAGRQITAAAELEQQVLVEINRLREEHDLGPLRLSPGLTTAARAHSLAMARYGFFRHASHDGSPFWKRVKALYAPTGRGYWGVGENMVWASPELNAEQALEMWLKSPPHRKNLLTPMWREVGLGGVRALGAPGVYGGLDVTILTADFGVR